MKIVFSAVAIVVVLMIGAQSAYALTEYQLGFKRGVSDGKSSSDLGPTLTAAIDIIVKHPHSFYEGWLDGYCSINPNGGSDADDFTFSCSDSRAFAISAFESGFQHGVSDAKCVHQPGCEYYMTQPGKGFAFHTPEFNRAYVVGYCSISGLHTGFDAEQASFDCDKGSDSWNYEIKG
jgi:hypothetical protein